MISILMPILYYSNNIANAIQSIILQTYEKWELIIGVNSKITKFDKVWVFLSKLENSKIKIMVLNCGNRSDSLNTLYKYARFEWIGINDINDMWLYDKLEQQMYIASGSEYKIIGTQIKYKENKYFSKSIPTRDISEFNFCEENPINSSSVIIHRSTNPYWDNKWSPHEDYDLWFRLKKRGLKFYNLHGFYVIICENMNNTITYDKQNNFVLSLLLQNQKNQKSKKIIN
jgi:glycosyltransferase involved in cell wall biosynthesis